MLKLMKYEFHKNRTGLLVMLLAAAGLYVLAPLGRALDKGDLMILSVVLLFIYAFAAYVYVLVRGIAAYSGELRGKTGYLLMMVPRSALSILFGKLLFTLVFGLLMMAVSCAALMASGTILLGEIYELKGMLTTLRFLLMQTGIDPAMLGNVALFFVAAVTTSVLAVVAMGYLAVTLSATLLQNGKLRGFASFALFIGLSALTGYLQNLITPEIEMFATYAEAMRAVLPVILLDLALACVYTAASAVLLKKWVSL